MIELIQLLILMFCFCFGASRCHPPLIDWRIAGGKLADIRNFPYQLSLECAFPEGYKHGCGAAVIGEKWAITAAHCIYRFEAASLRVRGATKLRQTGGETYDISDKIVHPSYNPSIDDYDVGILKVSRPFRYRDVLKPIALAQRPPPVGATVIVSGWGSTKSGEPDAKELHQVDLQVVDHKKCNAAYKKWGGVTPRMLCAATSGSKKKDACGGDSGGPLVAEGKILVGLVSRGMACGEKRYPGIYTDVAFVRDWVKRVTGIS